MDSVNVKQICLLLITSEQSLCFLYEQHAHHVSYLGFVCGVCVLKLQNIKKAATMG